MIDFLNSLDKNDVINNDIINLNDKLKPKTLIGKSNYLFLINDSNNEIYSHQTGILIGKNIEFKLNNYNLKKYLLIVLPNKSYTLKKYLPDNYNLKYRPGFDKYYKMLKKNILDGYKLLCNNEECFYKTDTHINLKGMLIIFIAFIKKIKKIFNIKININENISVRKKNVNSLTEINEGIGDLTWKCNLVNQYLEDVRDCYYYNNTINCIYNIYIINKNSELFFLDYNLINKNSELTDKIVNWNIISNYIIYKKNINIENNFKVIIFYDSFLLSTIKLYLNLFAEIYMIKNIYDCILIDKINPDYIFEFRVERFLL